MTRNLLPEDPDERRMFDESVKLYEGDPLRAIAVTLTLWSKTVPQNGSFAQTLTIMSNELWKALDSGR